MGYSGPTKEENEDFASLIGEVGHGTDETNGSKENSNDNTNHTYDNGNSPTEEEYDEKEERSSTQNTACYGPEVDAELNGNVFYRINVKPTKLIIAYSQTKQLIEATVSLKKDETMAMLRLVHNKTFLTSIPTKVVRHKNPL